MDVLQIEHKLVPVIARMENHGVKINMNLLEQTKLKLAQLKSDVQVEIKEHLGDINIDSPDQLSKSLFEGLNLEPKVDTINKNSNYPVNKSHLLKLIDQHEVIPLLLSYRKVVSLLKFCSNLDNIHRLTGRLHCSINQIGTETGRCSSSGPNLQNIPNPKGEYDSSDVLKQLEYRFRQMFIPKKQWIYICADYSQIELRVMAHYSQDPFLMKAYHEGLDIHKLTASEVFGVEFSKVTDEQRKIAKSINFGLIYGKTAYGLASTLTEVTGRSYTVEQAQGVIDGYFSKLPKVKQCLDAFIDQADDVGYATTLFGRKRAILQLQSSKLTVRQSGKRIAMNTPIQGTAADILKIAMIKCDQEIMTRGLKSKMILTVHDELLFEVPKHEEDIMKSIVKNTMEGAVKLSVPLEVGMETGTNWAMAH